jgi:hypothetical protein
MKKTRKAYARPKIKVWGTIADLTKTGETEEGADAKGGSINGENPGV